MSAVPFGITDWSQVPSTVANGTTGIATMRTVQHEGLRIPLVEYSADHLADHWCQLGHLVFVLEGDPGPHAGGSTNTRTAA